MCTNVVFASASPHPRVPWAPLVCADTGTHTKGRLPGTAEHPGFPLASGTAAPAAAADSSWDAAGGSSALRLSEDKSRGNEEEIILSKRWQLNVKFTPAVRQRGKGGWSGWGEAKPFCAAAPCFTSFWHTAEPAPSPLLMSVYLCAPGEGGHTSTQSARCRVCALRQGEQLRKPRVPTHVLGASWPGRNSCTQRHQHIPCVNAHTICQCVGLYGR